MLMAGIFDAEAQRAPTGPTVAQPGPATAAEDGEVPGTREPLGNATKGLEY